MSAAVGSAAWLDERRTYIGASEVAEALGLSPWGDPISLWQVKTGQMPPRDGSFRMKVGTLIEPIIGQLAEEKLGVKLRRLGGPIRHPAFEHLAANPDFKIEGQRGLVQAKNGGEPYTDGLPIQYRLQGYAELACTGYDFIVFARLDRDDIETFTLEADFDAQADLVADVRDYWQGFVETGEIPPPSDKSRAAIRRRYPEAIAKIGKVASAEQEAPLSELLSIREQLRDLEAAKERVENAVALMIGDADYIEGAGHRFHWSNRKGSISWKSVAASYRRMIEDTRVDVGEGGQRKRAGAIAQLLTYNLDTIEGLYVGESTRSFRVDELK